MTFTRREKHAIIILVVLVLAVGALNFILHVNPLIFNAWIADHEPQLIFIIGFPVGLYVVLDKERNRKE